MAHDRSQFTARDLQNGLDAGLTEGRQTPCVRPVNPNSCRSEGERLKNVRATSDAAVHDHRNFAGDTFENFR